MPSPFCCFCFLPWGIFPSAIPEMGLDSGFLPVGRSHFACLFLCGYPSHFHSFIPKREFVLPFILQFLPLKILFSKNWQLISLFAIFSFFFSHLWKTKIIWFIFHFSFFSSKVCVHCKCDRSDHEIGANQALNVYERLGIKPSGEMAKVMQQRKQSQQQSNSNNNNNDVNAIGSVGHGYAWVPPGISRIKVNWPK